jgi:hypothetical protein
MDKNYTVSALLDTREWVTFTNKGFAEGHELAQALSVASDTIYVGLAREGDPPVAKYVAGREVPLDY